MIWLRARVFCFQRWSKKSCRTHTQDHCEANPVARQVVTPNTEHGLLLSTENRNACTKMSLRLSSVAGYSNAHSRAPCRASGWTSDGGTWYFWVLSLELVSCQPYGAYNFELLHDFWKTFAHTTGSRWESIAENGPVITGVENQKEKNPEHLLCKLIFWSIIVLLADSCVMKLFQLQRLKCVWVLVVVGLHWSLGKIWMQKWGQYVSENTTLTFSRYDSGTTENLSQDFNVLLTVHPGKTLGKWPTWCTITLYKTFIIVILYMFRATLCSSSGCRIVLIQHLV